MSEVFTKGLFRGVDVNDAFARTASREKPVVVALDPVSWPAGYAPDRSRRYGEATFWYGLAAGI